MLEYSELRGQWYESHDCVFFRNLLESAFYVHNGATIVDVFTDGDGKLVFVFPRSEHNVLIKKWMERKPKDKEDKFNGDKNGC